MRQHLNWKTALVLVALVIVAATLWYTNQLARKLAEEERKKIALMAEGIRTITMASPDAELGFVTTVVIQDSTIPRIIVNERGDILDAKSIDTPANVNPHAYLQARMREFQQQHPAIELDYGAGKNFVYYGESYLLRQLRYFPYVLLAIILLFLLVVIVAISAAARSLQNQVWVGLSKETAHQLGTPLSSITGWLELLKDRDENDEAVVEMEKDLARLRLVADRFSKVGSAPQLKEENLVERLQGMTDYMQKRAPSRVRISLNAPKADVTVKLSGALFDWVVENLMRNALDAMDGQGSITVTLAETPTHVVVDVSDTGKGIPRHLVKKVFRPGFTTKKRGWGLGLSLARRIIEQYHHGSLFVKSAEPGKGTTFRILLRR